MTGQEIYELILESNVINFSIMIYVLVWIFKTFKLGKVIDSMSEDIKKNVTSSAQIVQNAISEYKKTKKEAKNIGNIKEELLMEAKESAKRLEEKNQAEIEAKESELEDSFNKVQEIIFERKLQKTTNEIQNAVYQVSIDTIKTMLNDDIQNKIISNCLDEFDKIGEVKW